MLLAEDSFISIQGEGKFTGVPSFFVRTLNCNLRCCWKNEDGTITKCDTAYASFPPFKDKKNFDLIQTVNTLEQYKNVKHIVLTGGEPMLQNDIVRTVQNFIDLNYNVTIETNGTIYKRLPRTTFLSISPKLTSSYSQTNSNDKALHISNNNFITTVQKLINRHNFQLKFVINNKEDLKEVLQIQKSLNVKSENIYLMPQGVTTKQLNTKKEWLINTCIEHGYNYCNRLHIELWGNVKGK